MDTITQTPHDYQPRPDELAGRTILVTGASTGIGATAAKTFAAHGATVILLARKQRALEEVYDAIEQAGGPQPAILPYNLENATPQDYAMIAETITSEFGCLDGLLHNAATLGSLTPIEHYTLDQWNKVLNTNLTGPFLLTQVCLPLLKKSADASILFTSDAVGRHAKAYWGGYSISKYGIEALSLILADELEANTPVRVNTLDPGPVLTRFRKNAYPGESNTELHSPESIMPHYLYLIGPASDGISGRAFTIPA